LSIPPAIEEDVIIQSELKDTKEKITLSFKDGTWSKRKDIWINLVDPNGNERMCDGTCTEINFYSEKKDDSQLTFMIIEDASSWGRDLWRSCL
jgi:hypothetical protein